METEVKILCQRLQECKSEFTETELQLTDFDFKAEMLDLLLSTNVTNKPI